MPYVLTVQDAQLLAALVPFAFMLGYLIWYLLTAESDEGFCERSKGYILSLEFQLKEACQAKRIDARLFEQAQENIQAAKNELEKRYPSRVRVDYLLGKVLCALSGCTRWRHKCLPYRP